MSWRTSVEGGDVPGHQAIMCTGTLHAHNGNYTHARSIPIRITAIIHCGRIVAQCNVICWCANYEHSIKHTYAF